MAAKFKGSMETGHDGWFVATKSDLIKSQMASLDFVVNRFFMKLFNTKNIDTVKACQKFFSFELPSVQLAKRVVKFESKVNTV